MRLILLRDLDFICIFIDAIKLELLTLIFQSDIVRIWTYIKLPLLLQSDRLNQLRVTPLAITVYLSHQTNPISSHHLFSIRLPKCKRNEACFINKISPLNIYLALKQPWQLISSWRNVATVKTFFSLIGLASNHLVK